MDPMVEFLLKSCVVGGIMYLWIRDMNARETRREQETAARENRMAAAIEKRDERNIEMAERQIAVTERFAGSVDKNTAATLSLEKTIQQNGCKFTEK